MRLRRGAAARIPDCGAWVSVRKDGHGVGGWFASGTTKEQGTGQQRNQRLTNAPAPSADQFPGQLTSFLLTPPHVGFACQRSRRPGYREGA